MKRKNDVRFTIFGTDVRYKPVYKQKRKDNEDDRFNKRFELEDFSTVAPFDRYGRPTKQKVNIEESHREKKSQEKVGEIHSEDSESSENTEPDNKETKIGEKNTKEVKIPKPTTISEGGISKNGKNTILREKNAGATIDQQKPSGRAVP